VKRNRIFIIAVLFIFILTASGCSEKQTESVQLTQGASNAMTIDQLLQTYAGIEGISAEDVEHRVGAIEGFRNHESKQKSYRILSTSAEYEDELYDLVFYAETEETGDADNWKINDITLVKIIPENREKLCYLGGISFWIRGDRKIEYLINGDLYKIPDSQIEIHTSRQNDQGMISFIAVTDKTLKSKGYIDIHETVKF